LVWCTAPERQADFGWVWPSTTTQSGHLANLQHDRDHGVMYSPHALRRSYSAHARAAGIDEDILRRLLGHGGGSITAHYVRSTSIGGLLRSAQETISSAIIAALGDVGLAPAEPEPWAYRFPPTEP
jgi:hypothetical protein